MDNGIIVSSVNMEERKKLGLSSGDTVRVWQKIEEKGKTRLQAFEGLVLAVKHGAEAGATFTVRKVASGVGVEKVFPLYSPLIDRIEIIKQVKVRRAKLYYIRDKVAREMRRVLRRMNLVSISTKSEIEATNEAAVAAESAKQAAAAEEAAAEEARKAEEAAAAAVEAAVEAGKEEELVEETPEAPAAEEKKAE